MRYQYLEQAIPVQICAFDDKAAQVGGLRRQVCDAREDQWGQAVFVGLSVVLLLLECPGVGFDVTVFETKVFTACFSSGNSGS